MKFFAAASALALIAKPLASPIAAQTTNLSYDDRVTCAALLFISSKEAEDPELEQAMSAHHLTKAIEMSGKPQDDVVADTARKMEAVLPAWEREDQAIAEVYAGCIIAVIEEFEG